MKDSHRLLFYFARYVDCT